MRRILHILTEQPPSFAPGLIEEQRKDPANAVRVVTLRGSAPDYDQVLTEIFEADTIALW